MRWAEVLASAESERTVGGGGGGGLRRSVCEGDSGVWLGGGVPTPRCSASLAVCARRAVPPAWCVRGGRCRGLGPDGGAVGGRCRNRTAPFRRSILGGWERAGRRGLVGDGLPRQMAEPCLLQRRLESGLSSPQVGDGAGNCRQLLTDRPAGQSNRPLDARPVAWTSSAVLR